MRPEEWQDERAEVRKQLKQVLEGELPWEEFWERMPKWALGARWVPRPDVVEYVRGYWERLGGKAERFEEP